MLLSVGKTSLHTIGVFAIADCLFDNPNHRKKNLKNRHQVSQDSIFLNSMRYVKCTCFKQQNQNTTSITIIGEPMSDIAFIPYAKHSIKRMSLLRKVVLNVVLAYGPGLGSAFAGIPSELFARFTASRWCASHRVGVGAKLAPL